MPWSRALGEGNSLTDTTVRSPGCAGHVAAEASGRAKVGHQAAVVVPPAPRTR